LVLTIFGYVGTLDYVNRELAADNSKITELNNKLKDILPYNKANDQPVQLINQPNTHIPTWDELKVFLAKDNTNSLPYVEGTFTCGDFAKRLHDNAEKAGIRCGVVAIHFENEGDFVGNTDAKCVNCVMLEKVYPHACNVFYTTDKGIVYIDDTGTNSTDCRRDAVAYIEIGKEYGTIDINYVTPSALASLSYDYYEDMAQRWQQYDSDVRGYNAYIEGEYTFPNGLVMPTRPIISSLEELQNYDQTVDDWKAKLDSESTGLPKCFADPMGIVKSFEVYW